MSLEADKATSDTPLVSAAEGEQPPPSVVSPQPAAPMRDRLPNVGSVSRWLWLAGLAILLILFGYYFYTHTLALPLPNVRMVAAADFQPRLAFPPPGNDLFKGPIGIAVDSQNNIYVANAETNDIRQFDPGGNPVADWPVFADSSGGKILAGMTIYKEHIYVLEKSSAHIYEYDTSGKLLTVHNKDNKVQLSSPNGFCFDQQGNIYIASTADSQLVEMDQQDHQLGRIGGRNLLTKQEQLYQVFGCAVGADGSIYAASIDGVLHKFDKDGNLIALLPTQWLGLSMADGIRMAADWPHKRIYIEDSGDDMLIMLDTSNDSFTAFGADGHNPGQFTHITAVAVNAAGDVYTVESEERRIQVFNRP